MVGSSFPGVGVSSHGVYRPYRFILGVVDGYDRLRDFSYTLSRLDFSHWRCVSERIDQVFHKGQGTFCGSVSAANPQKISASAYDCRQRTRIGSGAKKGMQPEEVSYKAAHRVHFRERCDLRRSEQDTHLAQLILSGWVRSVSIPFSVTWLKSSVKKLS